MPARTEQSSRVRDCALRWIDTDCIFAFRAPGGRNSRTSRERDPQKMRTAVDNLEDRTATDPEIGSTNQKEPGRQKNRRAGIRSMFALAVHYLTGRAVATDPA